MSGASWNGNAAAMFLPGHGQGPPAVFEAGGIGQDGCGTGKISGCGGKRLAKEVLAKVGLAEKGHRLPNQLSGGEQERAAIARALVNNPPVILADEPTGNLDSTTGNGIMNLLTELNSEGRTIVMVTHNPGNARFAGRLIRLRDGRIDS